jgi:hypothetical protein
MENSDQSYNLWLPYQTNQKKSPEKKHTIEIIHKWYSHSIGTQMFHHRSFSHPQICCPRWLIWRTDKKNPLQSGAPYKLVYW